MKITILIGGHRSIELPLSDEELNNRYRIRKHRCIYKAALIKK